MKSKTIITTIISLLFINMFSQVTLDIKERPKPINTFNLKKISSNNDCIYNLGVIDAKGEKSIYYIEKYNAKTLSLEYQTDLKICEDDELALVHPLFVPPVCLESNNQFIVFYCSYNKGDKKTMINLKTVNKQGNVNSKWINLISSSDIQVELDGMYWNTISPNKPVINYYLSEDKKTVMIEIDSPKFKKIFSYAISDLLEGKTQHKEYDIKTLTEIEKIVVNKCFFVNNTLYFSYAKKTSTKSSDFGIAVFDSKSSNFQLKNLGLNVNELFSIDYVLTPTSNKLFITGYLRYPVDATKEVSIENSKVKPFSVFYNISTMTFENKTEYDFLPLIAKHISVPKIAYGFIDKKYTPDQYLENTALIESPNFYYNISNLLLGRDPSQGRYTQPCSPNMTGGGVTTVSRDILITKYDKTGKLLNQYLLPRHTSFNTFAGSASGALYAFANKQRNFNYALKGDDLHFFYLDNKKNMLVNPEEYNPRNTDKCNFDDGALIHMSIKNDKIERDILMEKDHNCSFYSNQSMMSGNILFLDLISKKKFSEVGKVIIN